MPVMIYLLHGVERYIPDASYDILVTWGREVHSRCQQKRTLPEITLVVCGVRVVRLIFVFFTSLSAICQLYHGDMQF